MAKRYYISPHLDDAIFSCGGLIYQQRLRGDEVVVLTVCAGDPAGDDPSSYAKGLEERWGTGTSAVDVRRQEDRRACEKLGAGYLHLPIPDCIYRISESGDAYYDSEEAIFGEIHPDEAGLIDEVSQMLQRECEGVTHIYAPVGYGGHVDHRLTRKAVDQLNRKIYFYRELPYAVRDGEVPEELCLPEGEPVLIPLKDDEISAWIEAVRLYDSQISTFWADPQVMDDDLRSIYALLGGIPIISIRRNDSE
jgi:LmbE family N-acetylglucosaminyl deacetylase